MFYDHDRGILDLASLISMPFCLPDRTAPQAAGAGGECGQTIARYKGLWHIHSRSRAVFS